MLWLIASGTGRTHTALAQSRRVLQPDDIFELKTVGDPRISPDGTWVAFTMTTLDRKEDTSDTDISMVSVSALRPFDTLGVAPSSVEGRQAQGGPSLAEGPAVRRSG